MRKKRKASKIVSELSGSKTSSIKEASKIASGLSRAKTSRRHHGGIVEPPPVIPIKPKGGNR